ncbi:hypothetical protein B0H99_105164 [Planomicrobium soli]|uniref:Uncharacterized protein n=1 Tax=Planomicrobium soli TaxID=1176648 RepID=A0A2P8H2E4_9BACL|nr:hypothetical protein B0H99_105164 [Planomicrobium soli]
MEVCPKLASWLALLMAEDMSGTKKAVKIQPDKSCKGIYSTIQLHMNTIYFFKFLPPFTVIRNTFE